MGSFPERQCQSIFAYWSLSKLEKTVEGCINEILHTNESVVVFQISMKTGELLLPSPSFGSHPSLFAIFS